VCGREREREREREKEGKENAYIVSVLFSFFLYDPCPQAHPEVCLTNLLGVFRSDLADHPG
jgi:hypothetical protein